MKKLFQFIKGYFDDIYRYRYLFFKLVVADFRSNYSGSALGVAWSFLHPLAITAIFWLVFTKAFNYSPSQNVPFIIWFLCGLLPWQFFAGAVGSNTMVLHEYSHLIKKIDFRISLFPVVKIISGFVLHLIFLIILVTLILIYKIPITLNILKIIYYLFALSVLTLGLSWLLASLAVFIKDVAQIVNIFIQLGFFATPIFWNASSLPESYSFIVKFNPLVYIIEGYRSSLIPGISQFANPLSIYWFWGITLLLLFVGIITFYRLRPSFADVL